MRIVSALLIVCLVALTVIGQDKPEPEKLSRPAKLTGFLRPGMYLGVQTHEKSASIALTVYTSEDFEIAVDSRIITLDELARKYPSVKRLRDQRLKEFEASLEAQRENLPANFEFGEPKIELMTNRSEFLCKVEHIGDDYMLVKFGKDLSSSRVIATAFISTIDWHNDGELNFSTSVQHLRRPTDRAKQ